VAFTTVTNGAGMAGAAACTFLRLQPAVTKIDNIAAAIPSRPCRIFRAFFSVIFMAVLI
jgi:hypothetical protein